MKASNIFLKFPKFKQIVLPQISCSYRNIQAIYQNKLKKILILADTKLKKKNTTQTKKVLL